MIIKKKLKKHFLKRLTAILFFFTTAFFLSPAWALDEQSFHSFTGRAVKISAHQVLSPYIVSDAHTTPLSDEPSLQPDSNSGDESNSDDSYAEITDEMPADPFESLQPIEPMDPVDMQDSPRKKSFFQDNFFFLQEYLVEYKTDSILEDTLNTSAGFEIYKMFSGDVRDIGDFNLQARLMRMQNLEGTPHENTIIHLHNAYFTFFNPLGGAGKLHLRVGRLAQPFGLEAITDTHSSVLQLSNTNNFGFKKDWGMQAYGDLSQDLSYDSAFTIGSGDGFNTSSQKGMFWFRLGTSGKIQRETGSEIGISYAVGERQDSFAYFLHKGMPQEAVPPHPDNMDNNGNHLQTGQGVSRQMVHGGIGAGAVKTERIGIDYRYTRDPFKLTIESSAGRDFDQTVRTLLAQGDYNHPDGKWGGSIQYQDYYRDAPFALHKNQKSLSGELAWYFSNSLRNKNILRLNYTRYLKRFTTPAADSWTLQYYLYF